MKLTFEDIKTHAAQLKAGAGTREASYTEVENMYMLKDQDLKGEDYVKKTISPDPRNVVQGMARLMAGAEPIFSVPFNADEPGAEATSSKLEKFAKASWSASNRIRRRRAEQDAALMGLLYDEVHIIVQSTAEMARLGDDPRLKTLAEECPLIYDVISSKICYPQYDILGLVTHYSERSLKVVDVITRWGSVAEKILEGRGLYTSVTYCEYWNTTVHCVWVSEAGEKPILMADHGLGFIPIASGLIEGSELFDEESGQETRQMFLYTLMKSGLWKRQNVSLTAMYTMIALASLSMQFVLHQGTPEDDVEIDMTKPFGVIKVPPNAKGFQQLQKQTIDPAVQQGLEIAERKGQESTIYATALGQSLGANAPYSMVALLNQAGRLPLVNYQRMISLLIGEAVKIGLKLLKLQGGAKVTAPAGKKTFEVIELKKEDIPDNFSIEATLDVAQPQDDRANAQLASVLTNPDNPIVSKRWVRENVMHVGQSDDMDEEIWSEQAATMAWRGFLQQNLPQLIQMMTGKNPLAAGGGNQGAPQGGGMPQGMPQEMPPGMMPPQAGGPMPDMQTQGAPMAAPGEMAPIPGQEPGGMPMDLAGIMGGMNG